MTITPGLGSSSSHAATPGGVFRGRVETIDDPKKRNRIQVRIFGYQDDQGNISKDQLEWIHSMSHDSQIPGATSTHNYYPGSEVVVLDNGTEKFIMGSIPGFDGEKRLQSNPWGVDSSSNQKPDLPNIVRGDQDTTVRHSPGIVGASGTAHGANAYFLYENFKNMVKFTPYATGKGASPAPWGEGDVSKQDQLQSIGFQKNVSGSDVLNLIQGLDSNLSGAIKSAIQLILNLRNNGFTNAMGVIGSSTFNSALNQYSTQFGSYTQTDLINLLIQLLSYIQQVTILNSTNFYQNVVNGLVSNVATFMGNNTFGVSPDILADMVTINNNVLLSAGNAGIDFYGTQLSQFQSDFNHAVSQAFTNIITQINTLAQSVNNLNTFITIFGGIQSFIQFAQTLQSIATYLGIPASAINIIGGNAIGLALGGNLAKSLLLQPVQPTNPSNSGQNLGNLLIGLMAMFRGNSIALQELLNGGLVKDFLSKNPQKYQRVDRNEGQSVLKRFPD